jgi:hypothetical protein
MDSISRANSGAGGAARRHVELVALPTDQAIKLLSKAQRRRTDALLHLTC